MIQINFWDDIFDVDNIQYKYLNHTILHQKYQEYSSISVAQKQISSKDAHKKGKKRGNRTYAFTKRCA